MKLKGWLVNASEDGQYISIMLDGVPGTVLIKADDDGIIADIWSQDEEVISSAGALYTELEPE